MVRFQFQIINRGHLGVKLQRLHTNHLVFGFGPTRREIAPSNCHLSAQQASHPTANNGHKTTASAYKCYCCCSRVSTASGKSPLVCGSVETLVNLLAARQLTVSPATLASVVAMDMPPNCFYHLAAPKSRFEDEFYLEPTVVATNARTWFQENLADQQVVQGREQLSAQSRVLPTSVALLMTKNENQPRSPSILERYAESVPLSASCQSVQKRCLFPDCTKMSVSKGLCRGHGGGRRCHFPGGCTKSAQSRSTFCWAHGGGLRCDVDTCMRSRKTKHFCVAHMHLETEDAQASSPGKSLRVSRTRRSRYVPIPTRNHRQSSHRILPSLGQALSAASLSPPSFPILHSRYVDK